MDLSILSCRFLEVSTPTLATGDEFLSILSCRFGVRREPMPDAQRSIFQFYLVDSAYRLSSKGKTGLIFQFYLVDSKIPMNEQNSGGGFFQFYLVDS